MKLPLASENIFPSSKENFIALQDYYFPDLNEKEKAQSLERFQDNFSSLKFSLNQYEFGARLCRENVEILNLFKFSGLPKARIYYVLMALFISKNNWDKGTSKSHRERLIAFRTVVQNQPDLIRRIDNKAYDAAVYPKTKENLLAVLDSCFPKAGDAERKLSLIHFHDSRNTLATIHLAAQFCDENHSFLDEYGVSPIPSERIHEVITAIFTPSYLWPTMEFERNGERFKKLKKTYLDYLRPKKEIN